MNIYILFPTVRPQMMYSTYLDWLEKSNNKDNIYLKVAVSTEEHKKEVEALNINNCEIIMSDNKIRGVCFPAYVLTSQLEANDEDIVILASDDFFAPDNWDTYLINRFSNFDGCLLVYDGYQRLEITDRTSIPLPILTFGCLKKLNKAVYHPSYTHMFGDTELYFNVRDLGLLSDERATDTTLFDHRHFVMGKRSKDSNDDAYHKSWNKDEDNYRTRMKLPVEERLKIEVNLNG